MRTEGRRLGTGFAVPPRRGRDRRALRRELPACLAQAFSDSSCRQLFISRLHHLHTAPPTPHFASALFGSRFSQSNSRACDVPGEDFVPTACAVQLWRPHFFRSPSQACHILPKTWAGILPPLVPHPGGHRNGTRCCTGPCVTPATRPTAIPIHQLTSPSHRRSSPSSPISHFLCQGNVSQVILCFHSSKARII